MTCVFCGIAAGREPADIRERMADCTCFVPLNPVTSGHLLVIPDEHVDHTLQEPWITGKVFEVAARIAMYKQGDFNLLTSVGPAATQTINHLHVHLVPRRAGDGLMLPWSERSPKSNPLTDDV